MKLRLLSASLLGIALLPAHASAAALVFPGGACDTTIDHDFPVTLFQAAYIGGLSSQDVVITCPMPKTNSSTGGLASGFVRVRSTNANLSSCAMRALTQYGSVLSGQNAMITTVNQDVSVSLGGVTSSSSYGYFALSCSLSGGSTLYSYRYTEQT